MGAQRLRRYSFALPTHSSAWATPEKLLAGHPNEAVCPLQFLIQRGVIQYRDHHQRQHGGDQNAEDQRDG